jgi:predicted CXXCH cytochrome family protein
VCSGCHDQEIKRRSGPAIPSVSREIAAGKFLHEPVARGDCRSCHFAHFSSHASLLKSEYAASFYAEFSESTYELCFSCHDRRLALEERTNRTQFRDGDRNLHFLHVNRRKGRTCGVCHEPHAAQQPALLRESVAFGAGSWALPIRFERKATGGTCASGCHQELGYDNTSPPPAPKDKPLPKSGAPGVSPGNSGDGE